MSQPAQCGEERVARTLGIKAIHVYRLEPRNGKTFVRTQESYDGLVARLFRGSLQKTLDTALRDGLRHLKEEAERRTTLWLRSSSMADGDSWAEAETDFEECLEEALKSLPDELRSSMTNVAIVVEDEPPPGMALLGLYQGVPLTRRSSAYGGVLPDKITIYRRPLERHYGADPARLRREIRRVVLHEVAHHFGISDERLREMDRY